MGTVAIVIIIVVVLLAVAGVAALVLARRRKQQQLVEQFGPEYERRVAETGDRKQAEQELQQRKERHDQHQLRPLQPDERERLQADWQQVQRGFVDNPGGAVEHADALLVTIMRQRGYPVEDGQRRTDDLSVAQPHLVEDYRRAQDVITSHRQGTASTEDLRYAFTRSAPSSRRCSTTTAARDTASTDRRGDQQGRHQHERHDRADPGLAPGCRRPADRAPRRRHGTDSPAAARRSARAGCASRGSARPGRAAGRPGRSGPATVGASRARRTRRTPGAQAMSHPEQGRPTERPAGRGAPGRVRRGPAAEPAGR